MNTRSRRPRERTSWLTAALALAAANISSKVCEGTPAMADHPTSNAVQQMSQPGAHEAALTAQAGTWDVVATLWLAPHASPMVTRGLIAQGFQTVAD